MADFLCSRCALKTFAIWLHTLILHTCRELCNKEWNANSDYFGSAGSHRRRKRKGAQKGAARASCKRGRCLMMIACSRRPEAKASRMEEEIRFSVIIPCLNEQLVIGRCLEAL